MKHHSGIFPVTKMAKALSVSRSRYYAWLKSGLSCRRQRDAKLLTEIQIIFEESRKTYGSPRIHAALRAQNERCSRKRVARIMRENNISVRRKRKFKVTTNSNHNYRLAPNILNREFEVSVPNTVWVSDITYICTRQGWLYLCIILDLFSRKAVGWAMSTRIDAQLALDALEMAVLHRRPGRKLIFHSDRGVQYASDAFRAKLDKYGFIQSMSRKGDCWDNACAESFFGTVKTEKVRGRVFTTRDEARQELFEYIAVFYNRTRRHSYLDYYSPEKYECIMTTQEKSA